MTNLLDAFEWAVTIELGSPEVYSLSQRAWPRFLLEESDRPDPILKFQIGLEDFKKRFKVFGIREKSSGKLVAFIQAVHVEIDLQASALPDLGWRFSIQNAATRSAKNALSLVEASIDPAFRGLKLSKHLIARAKQEAVESGYQAMIAPVRPTAKVGFADESIEAYLARKTSDGKIFDPWLRAHVDAGATIANVCHHSVCVTATLPKWREWTQLALERSGEHLIPDGLAPLRVDTSSDIGIYQEPNVWVKYNLA